MRRKGNALMRGIMSGHFNPRINVKVEKYLFTELTKIAEENDITRTELLRLIIRRYVEQNRLRPIKIEKRDIEW